MGGCGELLPSLKTYKEAVLCIEKGENLEWAVGCLEELKETLYHHDQLLYQNCLGWLKQAQKKLRKDKDKRLYERLTKEGKVTIRLKYAHHDLVEYFRRLFADRIIYENYATYAVRKGIDFVLRRKDGTCTFLNVYHKTRNANFIGSYLGAVKILEMKLNIRYPVYYVAPRYTTQAVKALLATPIIKAVWFEYSKEDGEIRLHRDLKTQPKSFSPEDTYLNFS